MNLESILALSALLASIYAVVPRDKRLNFVIKVGWLDWFIIVSGLIIIHYFQFYSFFRSVNLTPTFGLYRWGINPNNASYLIVILTVLFIFFRLKFSKLSKSRICKFRELTEELIRTGNHTILIKLLEDHFLSILKIYRNDFIVSNIRHKFQSIFKFLNKKKRQKNSKEVDAAHDVIRQTFLSEDFIHSLATNRPYFATTILESPVYEKYDFLTYYIKESLSNTSGVLYYEIKNNQNLSFSPHRYYIDDTNKLLFYLLNDAKTAEKLQVWKPFGDYIATYLENIARKPEENVYNHDMGDYYESGKWKCPIFITIRFFDLMVTEALYQNIQWHMWLFYFPIFTQKIVESYDPKRSTIKKISEWPTKYGYLLYEIVSSMCGWAKAAIDIPPDQENIVLKNVDTENENGNIPKSSILALCRGFRFILNSKDISFEFQSYLLDSVFSLYFDLKKFPHTSQLSSVLRMALFQGGEYYMGETEDYYREQINLAFDSFDTIPYDREDVLEFREYISSFSYFISEGRPL